MCSIPPAAFAIFAQFCHTCETHGFLPEQWQFARQTHLPKAGKGIRSSDGARDVSSLRPLTLFSIWYRLWATTRLKSSDVQEWINNWWPAEATGGKAGKEIYDALFPLIDSAIQKKYLVSLDFSLAFDFATPSIVTAFLHDLGMPPLIMSMLHKLWSNQSRILSYENACLETPELVQTSLPQGDPWSQLGMVAILSPAMWNIAREHPTVIHRSFVDDRSWAADTVEETLAVEQIWKTWSGILQLKENQDKSQYFHASAKGRRKLIEQGGLPHDKVSNQINILGHYFNGLQDRQVNCKELLRVKNAMQYIRKVAFLPVTHRFKKCAIAAAPLAHVEFGWLMKPPPLKPCEKIQTAIKQTLQEPLHSSPHLRDILRGHRLHMMFRVCCTRIRCLNKSHDRTLTEWHARYGIGGTLNTLLNACLGHYNNRGYGNTTIPMPSSHLTRTIVVMNTMSRKKMTEQITFSMKAFVPMHTTDGVLVHVLMPLFAMHCHTMQQDVALPSNLRQPPDKILPPYYQVHS